MVYILLTYEISRGEQKEALRFYEEKIQTLDKKHIEKLGGKLIGCWHTEYGRTADITFLWAYPDLEAREKVLKMFDSDEAAKEDLKRWYGYTPNVVVTVLRPTPFSPLQ